MCTLVEVQPEPSTFEPIEDHKAIIRDISVSGASFLTRVPLEEGERLSLNIQLTRELDGPTVKAEAKVVRVDHFDADRADVWSCQIAVSFDKPLSGHEEEIDALADRLQKAGLPW